MGGWAARGGYRIRGQYTLMMLWICRPCSSCTARQALLAVGTLWMFLEWVAMAFLLVIKKFLLDKLTPRVLFIFIRLHQCHSSSTPRVDPGYRAATVRSLTIGMMLKAWCSIRLHRVLVRNGQWLAWALPAHSTRVHPFFRCGKDDQALVLRQEQGMRAGRCKTCKRKVPVARRVCGVRSTGARERERSEVHDSSGPSGYFLPSVRLGRSAMAQGLYGGLFAGPSTTCVCRSPAGHTAGSCRRALYSQATSITAPAKNEASRGIAEVEVQPVEVL